MIEKIYPPKELIVLNPITINSSQMMDNLFKKMLVKDIVIPMQMVVYSEVV